MVLNSSKNSWFFCVAPMLNVTNHHCRFFYRLLSPFARLYTEMITVDSLLHRKLSLEKLRFDPMQHPIALQLGGSDPKKLAKAALLGKAYGYDEINLNCGCPSKRTQNGNFGACMMNNPSLVKDCIKSIQDVVLDLPISLKHRLGLNYEFSYQFVRDFVGDIYETGCRVFIVHARNAVLNLSAKKNLTLPPICYEYVYQIKKDFPKATIVLNGGISNETVAEEVIKKVDGIMVGRAAWNNPRVLSKISNKFWPDEITLKDDFIIANFLSYINSMMRNGIPLSILIKPILGFMKGQRHAKQWRRTLLNSVAKSDPNILSLLKEELGTIISFNSDQDHLGEILKTD